MKKKLNRNLKVIKINGIRGLVIAMFAFSCLVAGFVAFPAFLAMYVWNYLASIFSNVPEISFGAGLLLWAIIAFSYFVFKKDRFIVSLKPESELSDNEVDEIVAKIKEQTLEHTLKNQILEKKEVEEKKDKEERFEEAHADSKD